ncbi:MAG: monovalent cation/H(+) antiporter subunit G [Verrucomicrobiae bacterium]|nr:monovalent cation/H(+) antiporter subunit G [Verrucomicrobiae bacterium]NNJ42850.1 monovalent cation/H(+) antiporter subunit G [Akkermansiaceae bacterium]
MTWLISIIMIAGSFFCLLSALGCLRMKDSYARMHVATKAVAFGGALLTLCQIIAAPTTTNLVFGILIIGFFYMTLPLAAHMLGRVLYGRGIQPAKPFVTDESDGRIPRIDKT